MAFSKSKTKRFNEINSDAPPPTAYNPKVCDKVALAAFNKDSRFKDKLGLGPGPGEYDGDVSVSVARTPRNFLSLNKAGKRSAHFKSAGKLQTFSKRLLPSLEESEVESNAGGDDDFCPLTSQSQIDGCPNCLTLKGQVQDLKTLHVSYSHQKDRDDDLLKGLREALSAAHESVSAGEDKLRVVVKGNLEANGQLQECLRYKTDLLDLQKEKAFVDGELTSAREMHQKHLDEIRAITEQKEAVSAEMDQRVVAIDKLTKEKRATEAILRTAQTDLDSARAQIEFLSGDVALTVTVAEERREEVEGLRETVQKTEQTVLDGHKKIVELEAQCHAHMTELGSLMARHLESLSVLEQTQTVLNERSEKHERTIQELVALKQEYSARVSTLERELKEVADELTMKSEECRVSYTERREMSERMEEAVGKGQAVRGELEEVRKSEGEKVERIGELELHTKTIEKSLAIMTGAKVDCEQKLASLKSECDRIVEDKLHMEGDMQDYEEERAQLREEVETLTQQQSAAKSHLVELGEIRESLKQVTQQLLTATEERDVLTSKLTESRQEVDRLRQEVGSAQRSLCGKEQELEKVQEERNSLLRRLEQKQTEMESKEKQQTSRIDQLSNAVQRREKSLNSLLETNNELMEKISQQDVRHQGMALKQRTLEGELAVSRAKQSDFEESAVSSRAKVIEANSRCEQVSSELSLRVQRGEDELRKVKDEYSARLVSAQTGIASITAELHSAKAVAQQEVHVLGGELARLSADIESWRTKYGELEARVEPFLDQIEMYEAEKAALKGTSKNWESELAQLSQNYASLLSHQNPKQKLRHIVKLKDEKRALGQEVETLRQSNHKHQATIRRLEEKLKQAEGRRRFDPAFAFQGKPLVDAQSGSSSLTLEASRVEGTAKPNRAEGRRRFDPKMAFQGKAGGGGEAVDSTGPVPAKGQENTPSKGLKVSQPGAKTPLKDNINVK